MIAEILGSIFGTRQNYDFELGKGFVENANRQIAQLKKSNPDLAGQVGADQINSGENPKDKKMDMMNMAAEQSKEDIARNYRDKFRVKAAGDDGVIFLAVVRAEIIRHDGRFNI